MITDDVDDRLYRSPAQVELDGVPLRARLAALRRRELRGAAGADEERLLAGVRERIRVFGHSHLAVSAAGAERHRPAEPGQRGDAARRRPPCRVGDPRRRVRVSPHRVRRRARGGRLSQPKSLGEFSARRLDAAPTRPARRRAAARRSPSAPSRPGSSPSPARRPRGMRPRPRQGTSPRTVTASFVIPTPPSNVETTSVSSDAGGVPARRGLPESAIEKQLDSAAAMSSSGWCPRTRPRRAPSTSPSAAPRHRTR